MKAFTFIGTKNAKGMIQIPAELQEQIQGEFRVIILQDVVPHEDHAPRRKRVLSAPQIKTKGLKLSRDEMNAK